MAISTSTAPIAPEPAIDRETLRRVEEGLLATWPALAERREDGLAMRTANGFTGRANHACVLDASRLGDPDQALDRVERFFAGHGLPAVWRVTPLTPPGLVTALDRRGYTHEDDTLILWRALEAHAGPAAGGIAVAAEAFPSPDWLRLAGGAEGRPDGNAATLAAIVSRVPPPAAFLAARLDGDGGGDLAGVLLAAVHDRLLTVHNVLSARPARRRGVALALMEAALRWGRDAAGADAAWLAVGAENAPARALYARLGFQPVSHYHYRRRSA